MGWSQGTNAEGREVGYAVQAACDFDGCEAKINRGLAYCCGGMHDGDEHSCGKYFCYEHLYFGAPEQLCGACLEEYEREHPEGGEDDDHPDVEQGRVELDRAPSSEGSTDANGS